MDRDYIESYAGYTRGDLIYISIDSPLRYRGYAIIDGLFYSSWEDDGQHLSTDINIDTVTTCGHRYAFSVSWLQYITRIENRLLKAILFGKSD